MAWILVFCFVLFAGFHAAFADETEDALKKAIETTTDRTELGRLHKRLGEHYVSQDRLKGAADEYLQALSLARGAFSLDERKTIGIHLSWAGRLKEAIAELRGVLAEDPSNLDARVHLAQALSWAGELTEAITEADRILKESPGNREALLVKANALRWKGDAAASIPLYRRLLEEKEEFDARLGLSFALLEAGKIKAARESGKLLKPEQPSQEKDAQGFLQTLKRTTSPSIGLRYNHYEDSDGNIVNRYLLLHGFWLENWRVEVRFQHTDAQERSLDVRAEDLAVRGSFQVTDWLKVRAGVGVTQLGDGNVSHVPTGHIGAEAKVFRGTVGAGVSREAFTELARIIENEIKVVDTQVFASQQLTDRLSLYGEYHYKHFSDENRSNELAVAPRYVIYAGNPEISIGYKFSFIDFDRQTGSGFFDPQGYKAHQGIGSLSYTIWKFYGSVESFGGYQSFLRNDVHSRATFVGGGGVLGFRPTANATLEITGDASRSAAGVAGGGPGFSSFSFGARFVYLF